MTPSHDLSAGARRQVKPRDVLKRETGKVDKPDTYARRSKVKDRIQYLEEERAVHDDMRVRVVRVYKS